MQLLMCSGHKEILTLPKGKLVLPCHICAPGAGCARAAAFSGHPADAVGAPGAGRAGTAAGGDAAAVAGARGAPLHLAQVQAPAHRRPK